MKFNQYGKHIFKLKKFFNGNSLHFDFGSYLLINSRKVKPLITERNDYLLPGIKKNYMLEWLKASVKTGNDHQKLNVHLRHIPFNLILSYFFFSPKSPLSLIFLVRFLETLILPKNNYNLGVFSYPPEAIA